MATPLTDSINALTQYANETTGKQDVTLSDAVGSLVEGYGGGSDDGHIVSNALSAQGMFYTNDETINHKPQLPKKMEFDLPYCSNISNLFQQYLHYPQYNLGVEEVTLKLYYPCSCIQAFYRNKSIKTINLPNGLTIRGDSNMFSDAVIEVINGTISYTSNASITTGAFSDAYNLREIRFAEDNIHNSQTYGSSVLSDESLVSIANGLDGTVTGKTLKLHATAKNNCSAITGTNDNGTFIADPNGTLTLADFITTVKGWTLA